MSPILIQHHHLSMENGSRGAGATRGLCSSSTDGDSNVSPDHSEDSLNTPSLKEEESQIQSLIPSVGNTQGYRALVV